MAKRPPWPRPNTRSPSWTTPIRPAWGWPRSCSSWRSGPWSRWSSASAGAGRDVVATRRAQRPVAWTVRRRRPPGGATATRCTSHSPPSAGGEVAQVEGSCTRRRCSRHRRPRLRPSRPGARRQARWSRPTWRSKPVISAIVLRMMALLGAVPGLQAGGRPGRRSWAGSTASAASAGGGPAARRRGRAPSSSSNAVADALDDRRQERRAAMPRDRDTGTKPTPRAAAPAGPAAQPPPLRAGLGGAALGHMRRIPSGISAPHRTHSSRAIAADLRRSAPPRSRRRPRAWSPSRRGRACAGRRRHTCSSAPSSRSAASGWPL